MSMRKGSFSAARPLPRDDTERRGQDHGASPQAWRFGKGRHSQLIYAMTKAGVVMLTKALAEEWSRFNINVDAIARVIS